MARLRLDHPSLPVVVVTIGIAVFSAMDAAMKSAAIATGVYSALLLRCALAALLMLPAWLRFERRRPAATVLRLHGLRAAVVAGMASLYFWGLVHLPLAEATALSFVAPLIALYLAALLLGERVRRGALPASLLGVAGVAVIAAARLLGGDGAAVGAGGGGAALGAPLGIAAILGSALLYAINLVLQRHQAQHAGPIEVALFQSALIALLLLPALPWLWRAPAPATLTVIAVGAVLSALALVCLSWGYARAQAQVLLPIEYTALVWSALLGWLWFDEPVGGPMLAGAALIIAGCWLASRRPAGRPEVPGPSLPGA